MSTAAFWTPEYHENYVTTVLGRDRTNFSGTACRDLLPPLTNFGRKVSSIQDWVNLTFFTPRDQTDPRIQCHQCGKASVCLVEECIVAPEVLMLSLPETTDPNRLNNWFTAEFMESAAGIDQEIIFHGVNYSLVSVIYYSGGHYFARIGVDDTTGIRRYFEYDGLVGGILSTGAQNIAAKAMLLTQNNAASPFPLAVKDPYKACLLVYLRG